jgi:putative oxidoreductase
MIGNTMGNGTTRMDAGLAALRVIVGAVFMAHGAQKLFIWGIDGVAGGFASPAVGVTEFVGGLALVVGLFTRVASAGLAAVMLGALLMVHLPAGFFLPDGGEFVLVLLAASASLALMGPGGFSVDGVLRRRAGA